MSGEIPHPDRSRGLLAKVSDFFRNPRGKQFGLTIRELDPRVMASDPDEIAANDDIQEGRVVRVSADELKYPTTWDEIRQIFERGPKSDF